MRALLIALCLLAACEKPPRGPSKVSNFHAKTERALSVELAGTAQFWCVTRPLHMCGLHLMPVGEDADSINFTITNSTRPPVGTYPLSPDIDPTGRTMRANYLSGKKGGSQNYVAKSGEVVVTESNPHFIKAHFKLEGVGVEPAGKAYPEVTVTGDLTAECDLEPRAAYTCD